MSEVSPESQFRNFSSAGSEPQPGTLPAAGFVWEALIQIGQVSFRGRPAKISGQSDAQKVSDCAGSGLIRPVWKP